MSINVIEQRFNGCSIRIENFEEEHMVREDCPSEKAVKEAIDHKLQDAEAQGMEILGLTCIDRKNNKAYCYHTSKNVSQGVINLW